VRVLAIAAALICPPQLPAAPGAAQLVTAHAAAYRTTAATVDLWQRSGRCWRHVDGPWPAYLGAGGLSTRKREGDGTTPIGTFRIGPTIYGIAPDPGVRLAYRRLTCGDWWDADPGSPTYNTFRHVACGTTPPFAGASEALWRISPQYRYFAEIEYNTRPAVPGRGSAMFLHVSAGRPTAGCVSLPESRLVRLLRWLRPGAAIDIGLS
jgi:L,D-peptidoglycan transpeptidase YkuD (ErfK/YbiS/YcfS/YnhG family)